MNLNNPIGYKSTEPLQKPFIMNPFRFGGAESVGGWVELGRTTLGGTGNTITVSSLADKRYYMVLMNNINTGVTPQVAMRLGNSTADSGVNYAGRYSRNGAGDGTNPSATSMTAEGYVASNAQGFGTSYIANLSSKEKLLLTNYVYGVTGAGTAPARQENATKYALTSNPIDVVQMLNVNTSTFASGSECVVLGYDPLDTHTTNFWEELASTNGTGATSFNSGVFTSKKYLMVQIYIDRSGDSTNGKITVGNTTLDTTNSYSRRRSTDGEADDTLVNQPNISLRTAGTREFYNIFIINNSSNEKLFIIHQVAGGSLGAGTPPFRGEFVAKWTNTSNQIDIIGFESGGTNTLSSTSIIKVWGSD